MASEVRSGSEVPSEVQSEVRSDSRLFTELLRSLLAEGISVRFRAHGRSMYPAIADGDCLQVDPVARAANHGEVVMVENRDGLRAHRVTQTNALLTRGDSCLHDDAEAQHFVGAVSVFDGLSVRPAPRQRRRSIIRRWIARWRGHF